MIPKTTRSILSVLLAALLLVTSIPLTPAFADGGAVSLQSESAESRELTGDGTAGNPYKIATADDLLEFAELVNNGQIRANAVLTADIDLSEICSEEDGVSWTPIGNSINQYRGTFDGQNFKISGLYINSDDNDQGLFGCLDQGGTVKDLTVSGSVSGSGMGVGGVVGLNRGSITDCAFSGNINGSVWYVGGVVGYNDGGRVENCYNTGAVSGGEDVGGVVGRNDEGHVTNCTNTGSVKGSGDRVGGVVGYNDEGHVENCYNTGAVNSSGNYVGGVVGENPSGRVENSYNTGAVSGGEYVGGVAGYNYFRGSVTNSYNTGAVSGGEDVGGVVGQNNSSSTVKNCYNTGTVTGPSTNVGGVVGDNRGPVENCYNTGNISGNVSGGVVGQNHGSVTNCYNIGTVTGTDDYVGGVVGYNFSSVTNCYFLQGTAEKGIGGGNASEENVKSLTAEEFAIQSSFTNSSWDFDNTWKIEPIFGRPTLRDNAEIGGTANNPYKIFTATQLKNFATAVNDGSEKSAHAKLMNNIDLSSVCSKEEGNWTPIGNEDHRYTGTFDGANYTISGLYIDSSDTDYKGLFGFVGSEGTVQNLTVTGSVKGDDYVGGVVGDNRGRVENCHNIGEVSGNQVGGVVGRNSGNVENCYNTVSVSGGMCVGGVVGVNSGNVENCYNTASVSGLDSVGGVVGHNSGTVENCYNTGKVSGNSYVGGIVGLNFSSDSVTNCYFLQTADVNVGLPGIGENYGSGDATATEKDDTAFHSGEVAYLLQSKQADGSGQVWGQTLGGEEDSLPTLVALNPGAAQPVYKVTFKYGYDSASADEISYSNGSVKFPAFERTGHTLTGWQNEDGQAVTEPITVTADTTFTAQWTKDTVNYTVTVSADPEAGGTVSGSGEYSEGTQVTVTATPATGYHFVNWTENGTEVSTEATFTFNATVDRNLTAIFEKDEDPTPTPTPDPEPSGPSTGDSTGWDDIRDELENAAKGDQITIDMGDETKVPAEIFESLAGKDVDVTFDLGDIQWSVNGADIPTDTDFTDLDLGASLGTSGIPVNVINAITGEHGSVQMTLAHDGAFGFTMTLTAPLGKENAGYWANLYHYDEDAEALNFEAAAKIDEDGSVTIPFSHASQYAIVIDTHSHATVDVSDLFIDIARDAWYKDAIQYAYDQGLMTGVSATEFDPEATTTRAMIVSILARLEGVTTAEAAGFADVDDNDWYATAVNWAANVGVVNGYEDNTFQPNTAITREQLASILMNYAAYKGEDVSNRADLTSYTDQPSAWAEETMSWAVAEGLINGVTNDQLQPQGKATRAQVAAILQRYLEA